ncbi:hypothetical protein FRC07_004399 [Ceratobasidium sp. 392]|nr:hypothetical protein FRC07_004399 [Ceratobasidium sp. 392]
MELARSHYLEIMEQLGDVDETLTLGTIQAPDPDSTALVDLTEASGDLGVDHLKDWPVPRVWAFLGLPNSTRFPFAHPNPADPSADDSEPPRDMDPKWHQAVGVLAMLEGACTKNLGDPPRPTMLCDDVGLGKTLQLIGLISMVAHLYEQQRQEANRRMAEPPFMRENGTPYLAGLEEIPNLPHLIVVPLALSAQWIAQITAFTEPGGFNVLHFTSAQADLDNYIGDPDGEYRRAVGGDGEKAYRTIIIAEFSAVQRALTRYYERPEFTQSKADKMKAARGDPEALGVKRDLAYSIFALKFLIAIIDEIHLLRNLSGIYFAALVLMSNAHIRIGATATPIYTSFKDVVAQGRLLRYQPMIAEEGAELCEQMLETVAKRSKEWDDEPCQMLTAMKRLEGEQGSDESSRVLGPNIPGEDLSRQYRALYVAEGPIDLAKKLLLPIVVRRLRGSKTPDGQMVLSLPPLVQVNAWSPFTAVEQAAVESIDKKFMGKLADTGLKKQQTIIWKAFFINHKHGTADHRILTLQKKEKENKLTPGALTNKMADHWNLANFEEAASTRVQKVVEVVRHFWHGNPKPPIYRVDGTRDLESEAKLEDPPPSDLPRKFIIFVTFHLHMLLIQKASPLSDARWTPHHISALKLMGWEFVPFHGGMTDVARGKALKQFNEQPDMRILLMTKVGGTGLNLTAASILINVSQFWSALDKDQISGRLFRHGQTRQVVVVDLVAPGSIDLPMAGYANSKALMSRFFLSSQQRLHTVQQCLELAALEGEQSYQEDDRVDDLVGPSGPSKIAPRRRKSRGEEQESDHSPPPAKRPRQRGGSSGKSSGSKRAKTTAPAGVSGKTKRKRAAAASPAPAQQSNFAANEGQAVSTGGRTSPCPPAENVAPRPEPMALVRQVDLVSEPIQENADSQAGTGVAGYPPLSKPEQESSRAGRASKTNEENQVQLRLEPAVSRPASEPEHVSTLPPRKPSPGPTPPAVAPVTPAAHLSEQPRPKKRLRPNPKPVPVPAPTDSPGRPGADLFDLSRQTVRQPTPPSIANTSQSRHPPSPPSSAQVQVDRFDGTLRHRRDSPPPAPTQSMPDPAVDLEELVNWDPDPLGQEGKGKELDLVATTYSPRSSSPALDACPADSSTAVKCPGSARNGRLVPASDRASVPRRLQSEGPAKDSTPPARTKMSDSETDDDYEPDSSSESEGEPPLRRSPDSPILLRVPPPPPLASRHHTRTKKVGLRSATPYKSQQPSPSQSHSGTVSRRHDSSTPGPSASANGGVADCPPTSAVWVSTSSSPSEPLLRHAPASFRSAGSTAAQSRMESRVSSHASSSQGTSSRATSSRATSSQASSGRLKTGGPSASRNPEAPGAPGAIAVRPASIARPPKRHLAPPPTVSELNALATGAQAGRHVQSDSLDNSLRSPSPDAPVVKLVFGRSSKK